MDITIKDLTEEDLDLFCVCLEDWDESAKPLVSYGESGLNQ